MARILLIKCCQFEGTFTVLPFPLGLMHLAAVLRERAGHEVRLFDLRINDDDYDSLREETRAFAPDVVGLSALTVEAPSLERAAAAVRTAGFCGPMVAGGPHPTAFPAEVLSVPGIDVAVIGEGEDTFLDVVTAVLAGETAAGIPGTAVLEDGEVRLGPPRDPIGDLDRLPIPAWDLVDVDRYARFKSMSGIRTADRFATLFTSRACPYHCTYCQRMFGNRFRARSPESVLAEVRLLVERHGVRYLEIVDDVFNYDLDRAKRILDGMLAEGLPIDLSFPNGLRCDRLDRDFLERLARFRHSLVCVPVESASQRIQKLVHKNLDLEKVVDVIDTCVNLRIYTRGYFMLGFPTETEAEMRATVDWAVRSRLHSGLFFVVVPFRGTPLYDEFASEIARRGYRYEDHDYFHGQVNLSEVPDDVLFSIQRTAYLRMATRPGRIVRVLRDFPDKRFVWPAIKTGLAFFRNSGTGRHGGRPDLRPGARRPRG